MDKDRETYEQILETCLELIWTGQGTVESVSALYPDWAEALQRELGVRMWFRAAQSGLEPRPGIVKASRLRLEERIRQEAELVQPARQAPPASPVLAIWKWLERIPTRRLQFALAFVLVVGFILITQVTLAAAQAAVPGDALYSVKIAQEKVQLAVSLTDTQTARLRIRFAQRRLSEVESLVNLGRLGYIPGVVSDYGEQVNAAISSLRQVERQKPDQAKELAVDLQNILSEQAGNLSLLAAGLPPETQVDLQRALTITEQGLDTVQAVIQEIDSSSPPGGTPVPSLSGLFSTPTAPSTPLPPDLAQPGAGSVNPLTPPTFQPLESSAPAIGSPIPEVESTPIPTASPTVIGKIASPTVPSATPQPILKNQPTPTPTKELQLKPKPTNEHRPTPKPTNDKRPTPKPDVNK